MRALRSFVLGVALLAPVAALLFALTPTVEAADGVPDQVVVINTQSAVDVPYAFGDISVGSAEIAKVVALRETRQLLVAGRAEGTTNVIIYDTRGARRDEFEITVIPANLAKVMKNVQELLNDIEGLSFRILNDRVYIQGEVSLDDEKERVDSLAAREPLVESMVTLSPIAQKLLAGMIQKEIASPGVNVRLIGRRIMLEGVVHSQRASERAEAIAKAYYTDVVNVLEVREVDRVPGKAPTVVLMVHFVEMSKTLVDAWGVQWSPLVVDGPSLYYQRDFTGGTFADATGYATAAVSSLLPRIDRARAAGYVRVLENPTVSVKSGDTAHVFSGQKVPFVFIENGTQTIQFEEVGITMDVTPYAQGNDVDLQVKIEQSALGDSLATGYPTIDMSELTTSQFCRAGESIVIGGLHRLRDRTDYNRNPDGVYTSTGLFTLYKSRSYEKKKTQFLVFLTPEIHESSTTANREIQERFNLSEVRQ